MITLLEAEKFIGESLTLNCGIHSLTTEVRTHLDIAKIPLGGCSSQCGRRMGCGHMCDRQCHPLRKIKNDQSGHYHIKCFKPCERFKDCGHKCKKQCGDCKYDHQYDCPEMIKVTNPCGHEIEV